VQCGRGDAGTGRRALRSTGGGYESGLRGRWHADLVERTAASVREVMPEVGSVLDVGCGSGALLRVLQQSGPGITFVGVDPAPRMLAEAAARRRSVHEVLASARAEALPWGDASFQVVVSSVSFGHWPDQRAGLLECRRVLVDGGTFVLVDVFSRWLNVVSRRGSRGSAHTRARTTELLHESGFRDVEWNDLSPRVVAAAVAR
jgi:ubiquinone/menaquinone biosynthesis C-methylase UbiE